MAGEQTEFDLKIPKHYFHRNVMTLQWAGIPINEITHPVLKYLYYAYMGFVLFVFAYYFTFTEFIYLYENLHNLDHFIFTSSYFLAHLIGCAKITVLLLRRTTIRSFFKSLAEGRFLPNKERGGIEEFKIIQDAEARSSTQIKIWAASITIMLCNRIIWFIRNPTLEVISPDSTNTTVTIRQLPYASSYIFNFDTHKSPYYELVFIHQICAVYGFAWSMGNADTITNGLMIHLGAQFKILSNAFNTITQRAERLTKKCSDQGQLTPIKTIKLLVSTSTGHSILEVEEILQYDELFSDNIKMCLITDCLEHHRELLYLCQDMEDVFNLMFLMQFLGCLTMYCSQLYQLSLLSIRSTSFIGMCFFMYAFIFQLLIFCWNGNELSLASEAVADAAYNSEWLQADKTIRLYIQMAIQRAHRRVHITAGKFSALSLATFAAILRGSISYFMVLRKVNAGEISE